MEISDPDNYVYGTEDLISDPDNYLEGVNTTYSGDLSSGGFDFSKLLDSAGKINWTKLLGGAAGLAPGISSLLGGGSSQKPTGYQGKVPSYQAVRQQVPMLEQDPNRRPGSGGRQYFTNTQYLPKSDATGIAAAQQAMQQQSNAIAQANLAPNQGQRTAMLNAAQSLYPMFVAPPASAQKSAAETAPFRDQTGPVTLPPAGDNQGGYPYNPNDASNSGGAAQGGLIGLARGGSTGQPRFLAGGTDGMADKIPATIEGSQPAKLGHGEFVIPADVVGFLGSGNSEAGAKVLYAMMDRVRKHAHGNKKQIKPANLKKTLPA
jgi:hypothetical protein